MYSASLTLRFMPWTIHDTGERVDLLDNIMISQQGPSLKQKLKLGEAFDTRADVWLDYT